MRTHLPTQQAAAGHIPADLIPRGADPRTVVIVQQAPRSYTGPVVLVLVSALSSGLVIYLLMLLVQATADAATTIAAAASSVGGAGGIGVTLSLKGGKR